MLCLMSLSIFLILFASVYSAGSLLPLPLPGLDGRIVGGDPVEIIDYPYQVSMQYYNTHMCGGSIISPRFVVTAAHCTDGASAGALSIIAGTSTINHKDNMQISVKTIHQHPNFDSFRLDYDISLLELDSDLQLSDQINIIDLPALNQEIPIGVNATVSGWGVTAEGGSLPNQLQAVIVQTISQADCKVDYGSDAITDRMFCAGTPEGGKDSCQGDSGGPLVINGQLIGIVSWGKGCAEPEYPGVYGNVPVLMDFITTVVGI